MSETKHPCEGLPQRVLETFEQVAIGDDGFHHPEDLALLVERGLIEPHAVETESGLRGISMTINRYSVPLPVHAQWCAWCGENVTDEEIEEASHER